MGSFKIALDWVRIGLSKGKRNQLVPCKEQDAQIDHVCTRRRPTATMQEFLLPLQKECTKNVG